MNLIVTFVVALSMIGALLRAAKAIRTGTVTILGSPETIRRSEQPWAYWVQIGRAALFLVVFSCALLFLWDVFEVGPKGLAILATIWFTLTFASIGVWLVRGLSTGVFRTAGHVYRRAEEPLNYWYMALIAALPFVAFVAFAILHS